MKITFNPLKFNTTTKNYKNNNQTVDTIKNFNTNSLECLSAYNIAFCSRKPRAVYAINYDGTYQKIESGAKAKELYGSAVSLVLKKQSYATKNTTFVYADEIEEKDGSIKGSSIKKILTRFRKNTGQAVYAVDFYGKITKYNSIKECAEGTKVPYQHINQIIEGRYPVGKGFVFAKAFDIELRDSKGKIMLDDEENPILDIDLIYKMRENFLKKSKLPPVALIDKKCNVEIFENYQKAAEEKNIDSDELMLALRRGRPTKGLMIVNLDNVVKYDENGDVLYDADGNYEIDKSLTKTYANML